MTREEYKTIFGGEEVTIPIMVAVVVKAADNLARAINTLAHSIREFALDDQSEQCCIQDVKTEQVEGDSNV